METAFDQQSSTALMIGASTKLDVLWQISILLHFAVFTPLLIHNTILRWPGPIAAAIGYGFVMPIDFLSRSMARQCPCEYGQVRSTK